MAEVSAVVVNHDGGEQVLRCLRHLLAQSPPLAAIIVVDSASNDGSPEAIRETFPEVHIVALESNQGAAVARNRGLSEIGTPFVLFVDDDVYLAPDCTRRLMARLTASGAVAAVPRLLLHPQTELIQLDGGAAHFVGTMVLHNARVPTATATCEASFIGAFSTSCLLAETVTVLEAGGLDETFFIYLEDLELGLRLRSFGHSLICEPAAVAYHDRGAGTPALSFRDEGLYPRRRAFLTMRNRLQVICLHYRLSSIIILAPALALYELATLVFAIRRGWFGVWLAAWRWQLTHARELAERRRVIQRRRCRDDGELLIGGPVPLAHGVVRSSIERRLVAAVSTVLDGYWRMVRRLLGWRPGCAISTTERCWGEEGAAFRDSDERPC